MWPSNGRRVTTKNQKPSLKWLPPYGQVLKVNVDGAFIKESGKAAVGAVIRDEKGLPLLMTWRTLLHCCDAEEAEAEACLEGCRMASCWPDRSFVLESECSTLIGKIHAGGVDRSTVAPIIKNILHYRKDCLCRAPNDLPGAFYRAHGKGLSLPCAYDPTHGSDKRTVQNFLPCVVSRAHGKEISLPCVGP
jgi:hypothetical protein